MPRPLRVLIVEDSEDDLLLLLRHLRKGGYEPTYEWIKGLEELGPALENGAWEVVISDFNLQGYDGLEVLRALQGSGLGLPFILVSGAIGEEMAVAAMRAGAHDYIMKDKLARLVPAIKRELGEAEVRRQRYDAEEALLRERERAAVTLASIGDGVLRTDVARRVEYLNPTAEQLTGWSLDEARGKWLHAVMRIADAETGAALLDPVERCLHDGRHYQPTGKRVLMRRDGTTVPIRDSAAPIFDNDGTPSGAVVILRDLSRQLELERRMADLEWHDPITNLENRKSFEERLHDHFRSAVQERRSHSLCYIDLDNFKVINDTCGHSAGDTMIRRVAGALRESVGEQGVVARLGGDEFGILLPDCETTRGRQLCEDVLEVVAGSRFSWEGTLCRVTASIGLVGIDHQSRGAEELLSAADAACYLAKERGGNRVHLHAPEDSAVAARHGEMQWISRLHQALEQDGFSLLAQPIHSLADHQGPPVLWEVLLRLRQEAGPAIPPGDFAPAAERYRLMPRIDRWVVDRTLRTLASATGSERVSFAINLSGQTLGDEAFLEFVISTLKQSRVSPHRLCFEITETVAIERLPEAWRFISALQSLGCRFALDDFGTGFNSFGYLRNLPVDYLKIDGSFVKHLDDPVQRVVVESINQIGHVMGVSTIAESIEDEETARRLHQIGVDMGQGYWLAYPQPLAASLV